MTSVNELIQKSETIDRLKNEIKAEAYEYAQSKVQCGQIVFCPRLQESRVVYMYHSGHVSFHLWNGKGEIEVMTYPLTKSGRAAKIGYYYVNVDECTPVRDKDGNIKFAEIPD